MGSTAEPRRQGAVGGTVAVMLAEGISLPAALVTAAVLTRGLGPEGYGRFTVAATLIMTLEWLLIAVLGNVIIKFVAEASDWRPVAATAFRVYALSGAAIGALVWLFAHRLAGALNDPLLGPALRLFSMEVPVFAVFIASRQVLAGLGSYRQQALAGAVRWLTRMSLIVGFIYLGWAIDGAILGSVGGVLAAFLVAQLFVGGASFGRAGFPLRDLVGLALPNFVLMLTVRLFDRVSLLMLNALQGAGAQVGYYSAAQNLGVVTGVVAMTVTPILISTLGAARRVGRDSFARDVASGALRAALALVPFAAIVAGCADEIFALLFGDAFIPAAPLGQWLVFVAVALIVISVAIALLVAAGRVWGTVILTAPLLPLSVVGHLILIPRLEALGAAVVTTVTAVAGAAVCTVMALHVLGLRFPTATLLRGTLLAVAAWVGADAWVTPGIWVVAKSALLSLGVAVGFLLSGELSTEELRAIHGWWTRFRQGKDR